jgi:hypothetical protein
MGLKKAGPYDLDFLDNTRQVFDHLRDKKVAVNPRKSGSRGG